MHYHCEVILPAETEDIASAVESVMKRFDENQGDDEEGYSKHAFWDFFVIGGRWAGSKQMAKYDDGKLEEFYAWLREEKVTVSGLTAGKQEIAPASQIPKVDAKWNELFPSEGGVMVACPIFKHSNDQYGRNGNSTIDGDICKLSECLSLKCSRVIFAGPGFRYVEGGESKYDNPPEAIFMLCDDQWNGCNHMPVAWDGTVGDALRQHKEKLANSRDEYREKMEPNDDWIAVTVDYHS